MKRLSSKNNEEMDQMSFLDHLDELRRRLVRSVIFIAVAFIGCFLVSEYIYDFLSIPVRRAMSEAERLQLDIKGITGEEKVIALSNLKEGESGRYIFDRAAELGPAVVRAGTSVKAVAAKNAEGKLGLYTDETLYAASSIIPAGVMLIEDVSIVPENRMSPDERMVVNTPQEGFMLYVTVSLYAAIALSVPFLLLQIWGFISPALYPHERSYVTPFILLSSISFLAGISSAYYILFPPAVSYLLGISKDFTLMLNASMYFDLIILIMLAMGIIFQMPAVAYVLSRIGIINARMMIIGLKIALVVILIVAAVVFPTADVANLMIFAAPMVLLYFFSIFIAWFCG